MTYEEAIQVCIDGGLKGRAAITTMVAIGMAESGLDNMAVGRNDLNGTPEESPAYNSLGLGWLQHDSYWLQRDTEVNGVQWSIEEIRSDPVYSVRLLFRRPSMILFDGVEDTYVNFRLWATFPKKSDQFMAAAKEAYDGLGLGQ